MSPLFRLCSKCGGKYLDVGRSTGKCPDCLRSYERERSRTMRQRRARSSAAYQGAREQAKRRDAYRCTRCRNPFDLEVHHVNGDATDHRLENLLTLCATCHRSVT